MLKLTMDYKMTKHMLNNCTKHMLNNCTLKENRTWLLVLTWHCYFIPFNDEHSVFFEFCKHKKPVDFLVPISLKHHTRSFVGL